MNSEHMSFAELGGREQHESTENRESRPIKLSKEDLYVLQRLKPNSKKWKHTPLIEANGIRVGSGIVTIEVDGKRYKMNTAVDDFGTLLPE